MLGADTGLAYTFTTCGHVHLAAARRHHRRQVTGVCGR